MRVSCYIYDVDDLISETRFAEGMAALPWEERRARVLRYRPEGAKRLCLGAGLLAAYALREAGAADLSLDRTKYGKPVLLRHPELHFNLSHSGHLAVCAVARQPVGADVELLHPMDESIANRCFTEQEMAWLRKTPDKNRAFTRLWTRKESFIKYTGDGLSKELQSFSVSPGDPAESGVCFTEREVSGHLISVCALAGSEVRFRDWPGL